MRSTRASDHWKLGYTASTLVRMLPHLPLRIALDLRIILVLFLGGIYAGTEYLRSRSGHPPLTARIMCNAYSSACSERYRTFPSLSVSGADRGEEGGHQLGALLPCFHKRLRHMQIPETSTLGTVAGLLHEAVAGKHPCFYWRD